MRKYKIKNNLDLIKQEKTDTTKPLTRQKNYLRYLCGICRKNNINPKICSRLITRIDYSIAIRSLNKQIKRGV